MTVLQSHIGAVRSPLTLLGVALAVSSTAAFRCPDARADSVGDAANSAQTASILQVNDTRADRLVVGDEDWFLTRIAGQLSVLQYTVTNSASSCRVWATAFDIDGGQLGQVVIEPGNSRVLSTVAPVAGPYLLLISGGPFQSCAGAAYSVEAATLPVVAPAQRPATPTPASSAAATVRNPMLCDAFTRRVDRLTVIIERVRHALVRAHGRHRARLRRKLNRLRHALAKADEAETQAC